MDPNETLSNLRRLSDEMDGWTESGEDPDEPGEYYRIASEMVTAFQAMDGWITQGGFLPQGWMPPSVAPTGTQQEQNERMVFRLKEIVLRVLRRDEALDRRYTTAEAFLTETNRLAVLIARWLVQAQQEEAALVMRMMDSAVTRQYVSEQTARLATEPGLLPIDNDSTIRRDET